MPHALAPNFGLRDFHTAFFTDDTAMLQTLVLTAQAFVILDRAKDFRTEQTVTFRLEGTIVNGFWLFDFTIGP